jgi:hypothetical protein
MNPGGSWQQNIRIVYETKLKIPKNKKIIASVNKSLKKDAKFLASECLEDNLEDYLKDFHVTIHVSNLHFVVDLGPKSGEGHDFNFEINRVTGKINQDSLAVGEVIKEPREFD